MAQSLFQFGQIETTLVKAKDVRPFVERLITLARKDTLSSRQRVIAMLGDRAVIPADQQEAYDDMSDAQRDKALRSRSGRRHRTGQIPAHYNKSKIPFVAESIVHKLFAEVAPKFKERPGGYTRIIRLAKRRIGDNSDLAVLQLVGEEAAPAGSGRSKTVSRRREMALNRIAALEGKSGRKGRAGARRKGASSKPAGGGGASAAVADEGTDA